MLSGPTLTGPSVLLRFGGTRPLPLTFFPSEKAVRLVIKNRDEYSDSWKRFTARPPSLMPPLPEIDFSKEILVVAAMGARPSSGYLTVIDGACEIDGQVEVFVSNVEDVSCGGQATLITHPADAVRLPRNDLPVVFHETQFTCTEWPKRLKMN
jgi:hypothetical protein